MKFVFLGSKTQSSDFKEGPKYFFNKKKPKILNMKN